MKKLTILAFLLVFFTGCINLKIRSELPKTQSYDFNPAFSPSSCGDYKNIGLISIDGTGIYDSKKIIIHNDDGKISTKEGIQWADFPKNLFKDLLVAEGIQHCFLINLPPFGTDLPRNILKLTLHSMEIKDSEPREAQMSLSYTLMRSGKKTSGFLQESQKVEGGDDVKALQEAAKKLLDDLFGLMQEQ